MMRRDRDRGERFGGYGLYVDPMIGTNTPLIMAEGPTLFICHNCGNTIEHFKTDEKLICKKCGWGKTMPELKEDIEHKLAWKILISKKIQELYLKAGFSWFWERVEKEI